MRNTQRKPRKQPMKRTMKHIQLTIFTNYQHLEKYNIQLKIGYIVRHFLY